MSFLTLGALLVAFLVAVPFAAHLLRRRKAEERPFPAAHLVPPTPPAARSKNLLEDRALFAVRALAVVGLAVLGATPFVHCSRLAVARKGGASVALAIVLDDSLSMRAPLDGGPARRGAQTRWERALAAARELTDGLNSGDEVAIVLGGAPARVALGSTTNMAAVSGVLEGLEPSDRATDLDGALRLAKGLLRGLPQLDKRLLLFSDLADGAPDGPPLAGEDGIALWMPLPELTARGEDCAVTRADRTGARVWARVVCTSSGRPRDAAASASPGAGEAPGRAPSASASAAPPASAGASAGPAGDSAEPYLGAGRSLEIRAGDKVLRSVRLPVALRAETIAVDLPADAPGALRAVLTGEDAIAEDDSAPVVSAGGALPMAIVADAATTRVATGGPPPIEQAFAALSLDAQIRPLPSVPEHADELNAFAALVVDDAPGFTPEVRRSIAAWVERGGVALLTLGPRAAAAPLGAGFEPLVPGVIRWGASPAAGLDPESAPSLGPAAEGLVDLGAHGRAALEASASEGAEMLGRWKDGAPFLLRRSLGRGAVLALTLPFSTEESDLALRPGFLALLDRFVGAARARGGARRIDAGEAWTFDGYEKVKVELLPAGGGKPRAIPVVETDRRLRALPPLAGLYQLELDGEVTTRVAAVPEREIDLRPRRVDDGARTADLGGVAPSVDASPWVALVLLGLLAVELLLRTMGASASRPATSAR
jgi:hypothetical protein